MVIVYEILDFPQKLDIATIFETIVRGQLSRAMAIQTDGDRN